MRWARQSQPLAVLLGRAWQLCCAALLAALLDPALAAKVSVFEGCATNDDGNVFLERLAPPTTVCAAGASLPASFYQLIHFSYSSRGKAEYTATGSTRGKSSITYHTVDYAGSDSLLSAAQYSIAPDLQMYPAVAAAVVPVYNLPALGNNTLVLDRSVLPKIFLGDVFLWNDTQILDLQDSATRAILLGLEDQTIRVVVRDDGSGTTEIFTKALSLFDPDFASRIGGKDVIDWCEDGMEDIVCTGSIDPTTGICSTNSSKFNCFGGQGECEGAAGVENWQRDTGFSTSGKVTCEKPIHGGRRWSYYRGYTTVGLIAAVLAQNGAIGYTVLSDTITLDMSVARMKNKAGNVVAADSSSVSFALMELGGSLDERGNADLMDAVSALAWPIAGFTYHVLRKGLDSTSANFMSTGDQLVMFNCATRAETFKFMEWFYTSPSVAAIGAQLGFTSLPDFIASSLLEKMLGETWCQDSLQDAPRLAKAISAAKLHYLFISDISSYVLDAYVNVYREIDPLVKWTYKVMPSNELDATLLKAGTYTDPDITSAALLDGLGIAHIQRSDIFSLPEDVVATPLFTVGVSIVYHLKLDEALDLATSLDLLGDMFLRAVDSFFELDASVNFTDSETRFKLVVRSDACDTTEIITAGFIRHFGCADGSGAALPICTCLGTTPFRRFTAMHFDGSNGCGLWDADDLIFVDSEPAAEAAVTYHPAAVGFWAKVGTLSSIKEFSISGIPGLQGHLALSDASLMACDDSDSAFTVNEGKSFAYTLFDPALSKSASCWPFSRLFSLVIRQVHVSQEQCSPDDFFPGRGEAVSAAFAKWLYSSEDVVSAIANLGLVAAKADARASATDLLDYDCTPQQCSAGTYFKADEDGGACVACPEGSITGSNGLTACTLCPRGTFERGRTICVQCASDEYQPESGQSKCLPCVANSLYLVATGDRTIPFIPEQGAQSKASCACTEGYYAPLGKELGEECLPCPIGATCTGTGLSTRIVPVPAPGYFFRESDPEVMLQCLTSLACPGGQTNQCGNGYTGDICSDCQDGFYERSGLCNKCQRGHKIAAGIAVVMFILISIVIHYIANVDRSGSLMRSTTAAAAEVQSMIVFLQIFNLFLVVRVNWPEQIRELMRFFSFINVDLSVLSLDCVLPVDYATKWRLKVLFPFLFIGFYVFYTLCASFYFLRRFDFSTAAERSRLFALKSINASCLLMSILYLSTTKTLLEAFTCTRQPDGSLTLPMYAAIDCGSVEFRQKILPSAIAALILLALAYPLALLIVFLSGSDKMSESVFMATLITRTPFKKKFFFWELIDLLRKFVLALIIAGGSALTTGAQLAALTITMIISLMIQVFYRPYKHVNVNSLVVFIFSVLIFVLVTAGMIFNDEASDSAGVLRLSLTIVTYIVVVAAIALSLVNVAIAIVIFRRARASGEVVQHQVLVTPELLDMTIAQLEGQSESIIRQCKEVIDDEDMQRSFNDAVILLYVLSTTSQRERSDQWLNGLKRTDTGNSSTLSFKDHHTSSHFTSHHTTKHGGDDYVESIEALPAAAEDPLHVLHQFGLARRKASLSCRHSAAGASEPDASPSARGEPRAPSLDDEAGPLSPTRVGILSEHEPTRTAPFRAKHDGEDLCA